MGLRFLASYPKSGNTWVRMFLDGYLYGRVDINQPIATMSDQSYLWHQQGCPVPLETLSSGEWAIARASALMAMNRHLSEKAILKTHGVYADLCGIPLFPTFLLGPTVYLVRDPRDVAKSYAVHLGASVDEAIEQMDDDGHGWKACGEPNMLKAPGLVSSWDNHVHSWSNAGEQVKVIRYEDLKTNPVEVFGEILTHFGIPCEEGRVKRTVGLCDIEKLRAQEKAGGFREAAEGRQFFGKRHDPLTPEQERRIVEAFGEEMERQGYKVREAA